MTLRDYQDDLILKTYGRWAEMLDTGEPVANVLNVLPCGGGKTRTMAHFAALLDEPGLVQAHRQELVSQISMAFAITGIAHRIIAPDDVIREITQQHIDELGRNWVRPDARYAIAGVDTLIRRSDPFFDTVKHWQTDEGHHLQASNKWGRGVGMLKRAVRGIGWTATPCRGDRKSLRRGEGGCYDAMNVGIGMAELVKRRYLKTPMVYGLPEVIDLSSVHVSSNGDFNQAELADAAHKSAITGDIVQHALRIAPGKKGVTFAVDVHMAEEHAQAFRDAGVRAAVLSSYITAGERLKIIRAYRGDGLDEVVNVDVLGEGFDLPGIVRASFGRPTASYGLFEQQFGRPLRWMEGEPIGYILDHVGNVARHGGTPLRPREYSLDGKPPRLLSEIPLRVCRNPQCLLTFEAFSATCPYCGWKPKRGSSEARARPEILEGDLTLYEEPALAELRAAVQRIAGPPDIPWGASRMVAASVEKKWKQRAETQSALSDTIDRWAGYWHGRGEPVDAIYRRFWATFGMDTLSALAQSGPKQLEMIERVRASI